MAARKADQAPAVASKFQREESLPGRQVQARALDSDLIEALKDRGAYSVRLDETPASYSKELGKGVKGHTFGTASSYIRAHAIAAGLGVSVKPLNDHSQSVSESEATRIGFQGKDKKIVPTGANRAPRGSRKTES